MALRKTQLDETIRRALAESHSPALSGPRSTWRSSPPSDVFPGALGAPDRFWSFVSRAARSIAKVLRIGPSEYGDDAIHAFQSFRSVTLFCKFGGRSEDEGKVDLQQLVLRPGVAKAHRVVEAHSER